MTPILSCLETDHLKIVIYLASVSITFRHRKGRGFLLIGRQSPFFFICLSSPLSLSALRSPPSALRSRSPTKTIRPIPVQPSPNAGSYFIYFFLLTLTPSRWRQVLSPVPSSPVSPGPKLPFPEMPKSYDPPGTG